MPELTATIVAYKNYDDIISALESIEKNTDKNIHKKIFIVDNGVAISDSDDINSFVRYIDKFDDVEYHDAGGNLGFGKGHNYVLPYLDSKYHAIVNPDILLEQDALKTIIHYLDKNDDVGMCIPNITDEYGNRLNVYREEVTVFDMFIRMFCKGLFKKRKAKHTMQYQDYSKPDVNTCLLIYITY